MSIHAIKRSGGSVYRVMWRDEGGRQRSRTFSRKRDAETWEAKVKLAKRQGELAVLDAGQQTLKSFAADYWRLYATPTLSAKTLQMYEGLRDRYLFPKLGDVQLRRITPERVQALQVELAEQGVGKPTIRKTLALLQGMLERAVEWGRLSRNPVRAVRKPPQIRSRAIHALAPTQIEELLREMLRREWARDAVLVSVLAYAGLRPGEALALRWGDVRERTLIVDKAVSLGAEKSTKTGQSRSVRLLRPLAEDLERWRRLSGSPPDESLVFPTRDGGVWADHDFRNWRRRRFAVAAKAVGLDDGRPYDLRHSFASLLIAEQNNPADVARQLGHTLQTLFSTYAHVIEDLAEAGKVDAEEAIEAARQPRQNG
ncbi:MAG TPA: site-specific integrase [Solirubrobacteraceae bacterium]|nr:site-specific integrase [Solirubrobacteraceae bacterium]